jgi:D-alanyl-D-alanine dipeptidase
MKSSIPHTEIQGHPDFVHLRGIEGVRIDLKYATTENFMHQNVYSQFTEPYLHRLAAAKLKQAVHLLRQEKPGWSLLVFDALRPRSVQRVLWAHVEGTTNEDYVANPDRGSVHNFGCAVDLTLSNERNYEVNMGTGFDAFVALSQPKLEEEFLKSGELKHEHHQNRLILRRAMTGAGFLQLPHEWWHYDAFPQADVRSQFQIVE